MALPVVVFRFATVADAQAYEDFMAAMFAENLDTLCPRVETPTLEQVERLLEKHDGNASGVLLAECDGVLLGTANLLRLQRPHLNHTVMLGLNVKQGLRGQGIGRQLLQEAVAWFERTAALERMELDVVGINAPAIHLYESFGFVHEGIKRSAVKKGDRYLDLLTMARIKQPCDGPVLAARASVKPAST
jgi:RimJ/RimL family protein N-acetyltransferase